MDFEWDDTKDEVNYRKHSIRFAEAVSLLSDGFSLDYYDVIHSVEEKRFIKLGRSLKNRILLVIYCERQSEELIRIISARKATKLEVLDYEK
jgi:uncharacterized DUF497 family protein